MHAEKTVARLLLYRNLLARRIGKGERWIHSQEIAAQAGVHAVQVRRDLMAIGTTGTPARGYDIARLFKALGRFLHTPDFQSAALVGVGRLGSAILAYFQQHASPFRIEVAFDRDSRRVDRSLYGCPCYSMEEMPGILRKRQIRIALLAVPAGAAQAAADALLAAGVRGLVNFAPIPLHTGPDVFVESMDITATLEKVAFFARAEQPAAKPSPLSRRGGPARPAGRPLEPTRIGARP